MIGFDDEKKQYHGTLKSYLIGFTLSLILTLFSFTLVAFQLLPATSLLYLLPALALLQAAIQLIYFLHLGQEGKPKWESIVFYFMVLILLIIVLGSLWIMYDLDQRTMSFMEMK